MSEYLGKSCSDLDGRDFNCPSKCRNVVASWGKSNKRHCLEIMTESCGMEYVKAEDHHMASNYS